MGIIHRTFLYLLWSTTRTVYSLSADELKTLVESLRGDDQRLFRWSALPHTAERQQAGDCSKLTNAAQLLVDSKASTHDKNLAAEYSTFCITDNPEHRAIFGNVDGIHKAIIDLVGHSDKRLSFLASHLIYIATYTNEKNHQAFQKGGAVEALAKEVMSEDAMGVQKMWAAAALQNLAASYCDTPDDGTCYWEWTATDKHIQLSKNSPLVSDGTISRKAMLEVDGLVDALVDLACEGPISEEDAEDADSLITPGDNALDGVHDNNDEVATWAAMACLKNLALEPTSKDQLEAAMKCACFVKDSVDWLEESKSLGFLYFMRRQEDPCWIREDELAICVDGNFLDEGLFHCDDYTEAAEGECEKAVDIFTGAKASEVCCECGGGVYSDIEPEHDEL
ncbi:hypothetical protein ACA910_000766 [Epithemia clementina (nom. ined.)]